MSTSRESIHQVTSHYGSRTVIIGLATVIAIAGTLSETRATNHDLEARCAPIKLPQLLEKHEAYKGKRVCVIGVAQVDGISFALFQPPRLELHRMIAVDRKRGRPRYDQLNNHWVKLIGVVHIDPEKIFACRILLESVVDLARPPIKEVKTYGIFFNEGPNTIRLDVSNESGNENDSMTLSPGDVLKAVVVKGTAKVSLPSTGAFPNPALSACRVPTAASASELFQESTSTFYFRVRNNRISIVKPQKARGAKHRWEEIERINNSQ